MISNCHKNKDKRGLDEVFVKVARSTKTSNSKGTAVASFIARMSAPILSITNSCSVPMAGSEVAILLHGACVMGCVGPEARA